MNCDDDEIDTPDFGRKKAGRTLPTPPNSRIIDPSTLHEYSLQASHAWIRKYSCMENRKVGNELTTLTVTAILVATGSLLLVLLLRSRYLKPRLGQRPVAVACFFPG